MRCPVCNAPYRQQPVCTRCQTDLKPVLEIYNNAFVCYNHALTKAKTSQWKDALACVDQAITWHHGRAEFHLLRGKILARLHHYRWACFAWKQALALDELSPARDCLKALARIMDTLSIS